MKELHANTGNHANTSYSNWLWNYGKQTLKGVTVMGLGVLGYVGLRGYWNNDSSKSSIKSENTDSVLTKEKSGVLFNQLQGNSVASSVSARSNNLWTSSASEQSIGYRHKRGVVPVNQEFQVSSNLNLIGGSVAIAGLPNSEFVITWVGLDYNVYARRFDNNRMALGNEFQVSMNNTAYTGSSPAIAGFSNGEFVITWFAGGIYAQRFSNETKLWSETRLDSNTAAGTPAIAVLPNEEFVITWGGGSHNVYAQRFANNGTKLGTEIQVNSNSQSMNNGGWAQSSVIAALPNGGFVISWKGYIGQFTGSPIGNVYAQRFAGDDTKLGAEFQVNNNTAVAVLPAITSLANNDFVITWPANGQIYAQQTASNGTVSKEEFLVGNFSYSAPPDIARLANNDYIIVWKNIGDYAQRFSSNSETIGSNFQFNSVPGPYFPGRIAGLHNGDFVITWGNMANNIIYARLFTIIYSTSQLQYNQLQIDQGATVTLNPNQLLVLSDTVAASQLEILVSNVNYGRFSRLNNAVISVFNFTQNEINNGQIQFTHDDSYNTPSYQIAVFDGFNTTNPQSVVVDFDQKPKWITQQITLYNKGELRLNAEQWLATDDKSNDQVFFELQNVTHGKYSAVSDIFAIPISNFTQAQVNASQIRFIHDGSNIAPSCSVLVSDGRLYVTYQPCQFTFTPNRPPQLTRNELTLVKGEQKVVDGTSLAASDPDALTADELGQLMFNFTAIARGQFVLSTNQSLAVIWAYQSQVAAGQLIFKHDGSDQAPSYNVSVYDGYVATESQASSVNFALSNVKDTSGATVGGAIGGTGAALLLAGVGIFGAYRYRRSQQLEEQRSNYPLANALYHELNIAGTEDFQSEKGIAFTNAVDCLNNELIREGVDIKQMVPEEINELAHKLATATKAQLGKKINPFDIQDYAQGIVRTAMTLSGKKKGGEDVLVEMDPIPTSTGQKLLQDAFGELLKKKGVGVRSLSAEQAKMIAEKLIKTVEENVNPSEGST